MAGRSLTSLCILSSLFVAMGCAEAASQHEEAKSSWSAKGRPIELGLRTVDGRWLEVRDLRGKPVLLFIFATFDTGSQAALKPLRRFVDQHEEIEVIGIAAQPRAAQLVEAWDHALDPPFTVGVEPYGRVENGESSLGKIESVPTYIVLDAAGYERQRVTGLQTGRQLAELAASVGKGK